MKKDNIEDFIHQHRDEFDEAVPDLKVWAAIDKEINPPSSKRFSITRFSRLAAAAVVLLLMGTAIGLFLNKPSSSKTLSSLSDISTEYAEMEKFYTKKVNVKKAQLAKYQQSTIVNEDLEQLDQIMLELQEDFKNVPKGSEEVIINAMINNYQTKLKILEHVLDDIHTKDAKKNTAKKTI